MSVYAELAREYDALFPQNPMATTFLLGLPRSPSTPHRALDAGCATASQLLDLAAAGWLGVGLEPERAMFDAAAEKIALAGRPVDLFQAGMLDASRLLAPSSFGLALCLGNTLPHLADEAELGRFARDAATLLAPGAWLVVQTLNYDRVLDRLARGDFAFPELRAKGVRFRRRYEKKADGGLDFLTELDVEDGTSSRGRASLCPFRPQTVLDALAGAGLAPDIVVPGWADRRPFDPGRDDYFIVAARRAEK
jgi:SAM-dependent methyltransferase